MVLPLEHRSYGEQGCSGKRSCRESLLMGSYLPMEDGPQRKEERRRNAGRLLRSDRLVSSLATWFQGHLVVVLFLLLVVTSTDSTSHTKSRAF